VYQSLLQISEQERKSNVCSKLHKTSLRGERVALCRIRQIARFLSIFFENQPLRESIHPMIQT
jgi:hypothetical protein